MNLCLRAVKFSVLTSKDFVMFEYLYLCLTFSAMRNMCLL